jgi:hypothetical protein
VAEVLEAGKVAAWRSGMVQYRAAALTAAGGLRPLLAALALGAAESISPEELAVRLRRLQDYPWITVEEATSEPRAAIAPAAVVGAFTGFGGEFLRPPTVTCDGDVLLVSDGQQQWQILADTYGTWLRRLGAAPTKHAKAPSPRNVNVDKHGTIRWGNHSLAQPHLAQASNFACSEQTLAVTIPTSHHVFLYAPSGTDA